MKQLLCLALFCFGFSFSATLASACESNPCLDPAIVDYEGGGIEVQTTLHTACFTAGRAYGESSNHTENIVLNSGLYKFVAAFVYPNQRNYEKVKTVAGYYTNNDAGRRICWQHQAAAGTYMSVFVICESYVGWVGGNVVESNGLIIMTPRPEWTWQPHWLTDEDKRAIAYFTS